MATTLCERIFENASEYQTGGGGLVWEHGAGEEQEVRGAGSRTGRRQVSQYHREKYCLEGEGKLKHFGNLKWTQSFIAEVLCFCNHSQ